MVTSSGFTDPVDSAKNLKIASQEVCTTLDHFASDDLELRQLEVNVSQSVAEALYNETGLRPIVFTQIGKV